MVQHVALGRKYRGRRVHKGTVVYIAAEGARGLGARTAAFRTALSEEEKPDFHLITARMGLVTDAKQLIDDVRAQNAQSQSARHDDLRRDFMATNAEALILQRTARDIKLTAWTGLVMGGLGALGLKAVSDIVKPATEYETVDHFGAVDLGLLCSTESGEGVSEAVIVTRDEGDSDAILVTHDYGTARPEFDISEEARAAERAAFYAVGRCRRLCGEMRGRVAELHESFERYGQTLMAIAIASGDANRIDPKLANLGQKHHEEIVAWLRERRDMEARRHDRLETVEWSVLVMAFASVIASVLVVAHEIAGWRPRFQDCAEK